MSLPQPTDLQTMDYVFQGQPFVSVPARTTNTLATMDYVFQGQPFVTNDFTIFYKTVLGVPAADVKTISGVAAASVKTINGVV